MGVRSAPLRVNAGMMSLVRMLREMSRSEAAMWDCLVMADFVIHRAAGLLVSGRPDATGARVTRMASRIRQRLHRFGEAVELILGGKARGFTAGAATRARMGYGEAVELAGTGDVDEASREDFMDPADVAAEREERSRIGWRAVPPLGVEGVLSGSERGR